MLRKVSSLAIPILFAVVCLPGHSQDSPPLGDVARQAQKDRNHAPAARVITDDDGLASASGQTQSDSSEQNSALNSSSKHGRDEAEASEIAGLKAAAFKANILITDSHSAIEKWVFMPATEKPHAGRIGEVTPGAKIYIAFVVTDYNFPVSERMNLTAHARLVKPNGKALDIPPWSATIAPDPKSPSVIVLNVLDVTFDSDDVPGTYTFSVTIVDHVHSTYAKAEEHLPLVWKF